MGVVLSCRGWIRTHRPRDFETRKLPLLYPAIYLCHNDILCFRAFCWIRTNAFRRILITNQVQSTAMRRRQLLTLSCHLSFRLSVDLNASRFHHFRGLYTPDSHQVGKMRTDYRLRVSYIVIYSRVQAKCPCGFRRCLLLHCPYLRYSDITLRVPSGCILQQHNRIVSQCVQHFCFFTLLIY